MSGFFLVFEGPDGSGKSTMVAEVQRHLTVKGIDAVFVRDPGGTEIGGRIREILLDPDLDNMDPLAELMLYAASRAQLVGEIIAPALDAGKIVISDRYTYSTLAYQGVNGTVAEAQLKEIVHLGIERATPHHLIFLDVPAHIGLERIQRAHDRMENKGLQYMEDVRQRYLGQIDAMPDNAVTVIDATDPILEVQKNVLEVVDALLG